MRRRARLLPYLAVLLLVLIALLAFLRSGPMAKHIRNAIVNELASQTGRKVSVGEVSVGLTGTVTLHDLEIKEADGTPLLRCPETAASVGGMGALLRGNTAELQVNSITLSGPEITLTRGASGELNVADLLKPKPGKKPFRGAVQVEKGKVTFVDQTRGGAATTLENVTASLRQDDSGKAQWRLRGEGAAGAFDALNVSGSSDGKGGLKATGSVKGLDLAHAMERLPEVGALSIAAGRGEVMAELTTDPGASPEDRLSYQIELEAAGAEISFPWLRRPVKRVAGKARLVNGDLELEGVTGTVAEAPVEVNGKISNLSSPELALDISASGIRVKQVEELLPNIYVPAALLLPAPVRIEARAEGPASEVVVSGRAETKVIKFRLVPWNEAVAKFRYSQGHLNVTGLSAHGSPRRVEGDMSLAWGKGQPQAEARLHLTQVPMDTLSQMLGLPATPLKGLAAVEAELNLGGRSPEMAGTVTVQEAAWAGLPLGRVRVRFRYRDGRLELQEGWFSGPSGSGTFSGKVVGGAYDIRATAQSVPVGAVGKALGVPALSEMPLGMASGSAEITDRRILVKDLRLTAGGVAGQGYLELRDWRDKDKGGAVSGELNLATAPLSQCLPVGWGRYAGDALLAGKITVGGTQAAPAASADLVLKLPVVSDVALDMGQAHLRYEQGRLYVDQAEVAYGRSRVRLTGEYSPESGFDMELVADPVDLALATSDVREDWGLAVAGAASAHARLTGAAGDPEISFQVACKDLTVNDKPVEEVWLAGRFHHGDLQVDQAQIVADGGHVAAAGKIGLSSRDVNLHWQVGRLDLLTLQTIVYSAAWRLDRSGHPVPHRELYALVPRPLEGTLSVEGDLSGTLAQPEVAAWFLLAPVSFAGQEVETICGSVSASRSRMEVHLEASHETAFASLNGFLEPEGEVSLSADIGNLDLHLLEPWLQWGVEMGGKGTINFVVSGSTAQPILIGDVRVDNLHLGPLHCEAAEALPIRLDSQGTLSVEGIRLRSRDLEAHGNAAIPVRLPGGWSKGTDGEVARGELHVSHAALTPAPGMTPVVYDADLYLVGDRVSLGSPEAEGPEKYGIRAALGSGQLLVGGSVQGSGLAPAHWAENRFDLAAELRQAEVALPAGLGRTRLEGRLELVNSAETSRPTLRTPPGQPIVVSQAELSLPTGQAREPWALALPFSPDLQVRVVTGEGVWLRHGSPSRPTAVEVEPATASAVTDAGLSGPGNGKSGYLDIGGTLSPSGVTLDGRFTSHRGVLVFPNGALTLRQGEARIQKEPADKVPRVSLQAEADGRVGDYHVYLNPEGQVYPPASGQDATVRLVSAPFRWNAHSLPHLDEGYVLALLGGPVAVPTGGGGQDLTSLLGGPGGGASGGELTGIMLPSLGGALGVHEFSVDLALGKPARLRIGERLFSRVTVSYMSAISDPSGSRSLRIDYEVRPRVAVGWSVDETERTVWELQSFVLF